MNVNLENTLRRIESLGGREKVAQLTPWLSAAAGWAGSTRIFQLISSATTLEKVLDHEATLRYALMFGSLNFRPSIEPQRLKDPDLLVERPEISATVEVTRFQRMHPGPTELTGEYLSEYGNPSRDIGKCIAKIRDKFKQATGPNAIIAVWNDDGDLEELEMESAIPEVRRAPRLPSGLQLIVFGSPWRTTPQLHVYPVHPPISAALERLVHELESIKVGEATMHGIALSKGSPSER